MHSSSALKNYKRREKKRASKDKELDLVTKTEEYQNALIIIKNAMREMPCGNTITCLNLINANIDITGAFIIADLLRTNSSLTVLNLSNNQIFDEGCRIVLSELNNNQTLTSLNLKNNGINRRNAFPQIKNMTLTSLDISYNMIGNGYDDECKAIVTCFPKLQKLYLSCCGISVSGAKTLRYALIRGLPLSRLTLNNNILINAKARRELHELKDTWVALGRPVDGLNRFTDTEDSDSNYDSDECEYWT